MKCNNCHSDEFIRDMKDQFLWCSRCDLMVRPETLVYLSHLVVKKLNDDMDRITLDMK